jgi:hypothetical protein
MKIIKIALLTQAQWIISDNCPYKPGPLDKVHEGKHIMSIGKDGKWAGSCPLPGLVCDEHLSYYLGFGYVTIPVVDIEILNEGIAVVKVANS